MTVMPAGELMLLLTLGLGYIVCYLANKAEKNLKALGYFIGTLIIALSGIMIIGNLFLGARICAKMGGAMSSRHKMMQSMPAMPIAPQK